MSRRSDANATAKFLQGALAMTAMQGVNGALAVDRVEVSSDGQGVYQPYFDVVCESGLRIRVSVTPMGEDDE